jgi:hypothetical protein
MQLSVPPIRLPLAPMLPVALRQWSRPIEPALYRLLVPPGVAKGLDEARKNGFGADFARRFLELLDIRFALDEGDVDRFAAPDARGRGGGRSYGVTTTRRVLVPPKRISDNLPSA